MLQPKTGMLALTLRSYLRSSRLPILFVPVYIGYERVLEGRTYLGELRGAAKKKVDLRHLQGHRRPQAALWAGLGKLRRAAQAQRIPRAGATRLAPAVCAGLSPAVAERRHQPPGRAHRPAPQRGGGRQPGQPGGAGDALHQPSGAGPAIPGTHPRSLPGAVARSALFAAHHAAGETATH